MLKACLIFVLVLASTLYAYSQSGTARNTEDIKKINDLNKEVSLFYAKGEYDPAIKKAKEELALREKVFGNESMESAFGHFNLGFIYRAKRDFTNAVSSYQTALTLYQKLKSSKMVGVLREIGFTYFYKGDKKEASSSFQSSIELLEKAYGISSKEVLDLTLDFASYCDLIQDNEKADGLFLRAIEIVKKHYDENSDEDDLAFNSYKCFLSRTKGEKKASEILEELRRRKDEPKEDSSTRATGKVINGRALDLPQPSYPTEARFARVTGTVVVQVTIDEDGTISKAIAVCGHPLLKNAAVAAAKRAKFSSTIFNGKPVKVTGTINYNFRP